MTEIRHPSGVRQRASRRPLQQSFTFKTWGGRRAGAGRKPNGERAGVSHLRRPELSPRKPVHVTLRIAEGVPSLRRTTLARTVFASFYAARGLHRVRLVHFSIQSNHLHLIVEAEDRRALSTAMRGLAVRLARRINRRMGRRGSLFADRYHSRILGTPLEVRRALAYVLNNHRHHFAAGRATRVDPLSSGFYFDGFAFPLPRLPRRGFVPPDEPPVSRPRFWLLREGWRRHGLIGD
jgi:REP element-mobilizing transposase RayT